MLERPSGLRYNVRMTCLDMLVPADYLLRKIERTIDFSEIYSMVKHLYKVEIACTAHVASDENNFALACKVTPGNVRDSMVFDAAYVDVIASFHEVETVAVDAG